MLQLWVQPPTESECPSPTARQRLDGRFLALWQKILTSTKCQLRAIYPCYGLPIFQLSQTLINPVKLTTFAGVQPFTCQAPSANVDTASFSQHLPVSDNRCSWDFSCCDAPLTGLYILAAKWLIELRFWLFLLITTYVLYAAPSSTIFSSAIWSWFVWINTFVLYEGACHLSK